ncbi:BPSS1780 family membrane protein [Derxia lacustris]|uniref:BPSS1780 family membrane protein n=1 Tax=Derxia lacustris TaxID=764842 RepID=UPI000A17213A|nr:BPSS1780 family membrane protein [Derxia lacustris]
MQAYRLPAAAGWHWIRDGFALFRRQPIALMTLFLFYLFTLFLVVLIPLAGPLVEIALMPGLSVGFLSAAKAASEGRGVNVRELVVGFRANDGRAAKPLLQLGGLYFLAICAVFVLSAALDDGTLYQLFIEGREPVPGELESPRLTASMLAAIVGYLAVTLSFWFAPALVAWHEVPPLKALFFSMVAGWRNIGAFFNFFAGAFAVMLLAQVLLVAPLALFGAPASLQAFLVMPLSVVVFSTLHCAIYLSYRQTFGLDAQA